MKHFAGKIAVITGGGTGMGVDQRRAHRRPLAQTQIVRSGFVKSLSKNIKRDYRVFAA